MIGAAYRLALIAKMNVRKKTTPRVAVPVIDYPGNRREPGGLRLAVLFSVGEGYSTSLRAAALLETSIDNVNGALRALEHDMLVVRTSDYAVSPVVWDITDLGRAKLRADLAEGYD